MALHRTQISLEDWQYEALRARAAREGRSMSRLIRDILGSALTQAKNDTGGRLGEIEGVGEDAGAYGDDHDEVLYGGKKTH